MYPGMRIIGLYRLIITELCVVKNTATCDNSVSWTIVLNYTSFCNRHDSKYIYIYPIYILFKTYQLINTHCYTYFLWFFVLRHTPTLPSISQPRRVTYTCRSGTLLLYSSEGYNHSIQPHSVSATLFWDWCEFSCVSTVPITNHWVWGRRDAVARQQTQMRRLSRNAIMIPVRLQFHVISLCFMWSRAFYIEMTTLYNNTWYHPMGRTSSNVEMTFSFWPIRKIF